MKILELIPYILLSAALIPSCKSYDDSALNKKIDEIEELAKKNTADIERIKEAINDAYSKGIKATVTPVEGGKMVTFSNGTEFFIADGQKGEQGDTGDKGDKGEKGEDAQTSTDISGITIEENDVEYIFSFDGKKYVIAKAFAIIFESSDVKVNPGNSTTLSYTLNVPDATTTVYVAKASSYKAAIDNVKKTLTISAVSNSRDAGTVVVSAIKNSTGEQSSAYISVNNENASSITVIFSAENSHYCALQEEVDLAVASKTKQKITIDWGDGDKVSASLGAEQFKHSFTKPGSYTVSTTGESFSKKWDIEVGGITALCVAVPQLKNSKTVWFMAHRSHTSDKTVPENSVAAVNAAVAAGADVIETDTQLTSDGEIVICHDQTIKATTNGTGDITGMTLAEIKSYNLKDRSGKVTKEKMPTLEEFLLAARGRVYVNLDYSPRTAPTEKVWKVVEKLGMEQEVFMYCNSSSKIEEVYACNPLANAYCRCDYYSTLLSGPNSYFVQARWKPGRPSDVIKDVNTTANAVKAGCLSSANMLHVNDSAIPEFTVNKDYVKDLLECYPDCHMIQNDCPDILVPMLKEMGLR